jgi:hypothetical protein
VLSSTPHHNKITYHIKKLNHATKAAFSGILCIDSETFELELYFHTTETRNLTLVNDTHLLVARHTIRENIFPLSNSQISSAQFHYTTLELESDTALSISLQVMLVNAFNGMIFSGTIQGNMNSTGDFVAHNEQWKQVYKFTDVIFFTKFTLPYMHTIFAIHSIEFLDASTLPRYNLVMIQGYELIPRVHVVQSSVNSLHSENILKSVSIRSNLGQTSVTFSIDHEFEIEMDIYTWKVIGYISSPPPPTSSSDRTDILHSTQLDNAADIDVFDAFRSQMVFFTKKNESVFGIMHLEYAYCKKNEFSNSLSNYKCSCNTEYTNQDHSNQCTRCNLLVSTCCQDNEDCKRKKFKCDPGYFLSLSGFCVLCRENTYCVGSQFFSCPHNSRSLQHGAFDVQTCTCLPGFFMQNSECSKCPESFFCNLNLIHQCPLNMHTTINTPGNIADCVCRPGFSPKSTVNECEEITFGTYWTQEIQQGVRISVVKTCPLDTTTQNTQSIGAESCRCIAGFKRNSQKTACVKCTLEHEACFFDSNIVMCSTSWKQTSSRNHDRCVCASGYYNTAKSQAHQEIDCKLCPPGYYCTQDSVSPITKCPAYMTSPSGSPSKLFCECQTHDQKLTYNKNTNSSECSCDRNFYTLDGQCKLCPLHMQVLPQQENQIPQQGIDTCTCISGYRLERGVCVLCKVGFFCDNRVKLTQTPCPYGRFSPIPGLRQLHQCLWCGYQTLQAISNSTSTNWDSPRVSAASCMGPFVVLNTPVEVNVLKSIFKFSAKSSVLEVAALRAFIGTVMKTEKYDLTYTYTTLLQYSIEMQEGFVQECLSVLMFYPDIWERVVHLSKSHSMTYVYVSHSLFCSVFSAGAQEIYKTDLEEEFCYIPFHVSKFELYAEIQEITRSFMTLRQSMFPNSVILVPGARFVNNVRMLSDIIPVFNVFSSLLQSSKLNRIVLLPLQNNALAVFVDDPEIDLTNIRSMALQNIIQQQQNIGNINLMQIGNCETAVHNLFGDCTSSIQKKMHLSCSYCQPDVSFFNVSTQHCQSCLPKSSSTCASCCNTRDMYCADQSVSLSAQALCGNRMHDFSEECDESDQDSLLHTCCTDCKLNTGYYNDPPCATRCGDFLVAHPVEECDSPGDFQCNMFQCTFVLNRSRTEL